MDPPEDAVTHIRPARDEDLEAVWRVEREAFGSDMEPKLVQALLADPTATPAISLLGWEGERPVGHILLTRATVEAAGERPDAMLLAPLAVAPEAQGRGVGGALSREALRLARAAGVELVFVLGHPGYYPRFGFRPAGSLGFSAPYPIPEEVAGAWMVLALHEAALDVAPARVRPAAAIDAPEFWRE
jgi:putative acetyltransferase